MNKTELAIIEQLAQLDESQQQQILEHALQLVNKTTHKQSFLGAWLESARLLRAELQATYGEKHFFDTQAILDEIRDEESE